MVGNKASQVGNKTSKVGNKVGNKNDEVLLINDNISIIENFLKDKELTGNMNKIMIEIYKNPRIIGSQLKEIIWISQTSIDNNIKKIKELGLLERVGTKKIGYWTIKGIDK